MAKRDKNGSTGGEPGEGDEVGGFRLEEVLGEGGMGVVWSAEQVALSRKAAVKIVRPEIAADIQFRERFKVESQSAAGLDDPNVVSVYHAGEEDGVLYMAMALVEGSDLRRILDSQGRLDPEQAVAIISQAASGLDAAHEAGLVHRDVKPANILVRDRDQRVMIADFGVAKSLGSAGMTQTGMMVGTLEYLAPEQIESSLVNMRTDIYALGAVLYEMLTGQVPFDADQAPAKLWAHVNQPPPRPSDVDPSLAPFDPVIATAMAKDPANRYPSAGQLALGAQAALRGEQLPMPAGATTATGQPAQRTPTIIGTATNIPVQGSVTAADAVPPPLAPPPPTQPVAAQGGSRKGLLLALAAVAVVGLAGAGAYMFVLKDKGSTTEASNSDSKKSDRADGKPGDANKPEANGKLPAQTRAEMTREITKVIAEHHQYIADGDYPAAYALLSSRKQRRPIYDSPECSEPSCWGQTMSDLRGLTTPVRPSLKILRTFPRTGVVEFKADLSMPECPGGVWGGVTWAKYENGRWTYDPGWKTDPVERRQYQSTPDPAGGENIQDPRTFGSVCQRAIN